MGGFMKGVFSSLINFFIDKQYNGDVNWLLFVIVIAILLAALWICITISKRNRLYINYKKDDKDNAYIQREEVYHEA